MKWDKYNFSLRLIEINNPRVIHGLSFNLRCLPESFFEVHDCQLQFWQFW